MTNCSNCGTRINDSDIFCSSCGEQIKAQKPIKSWNGSQTAFSTPNVSINTSIKQTKRLYKSRTDKKLDGVCGGLGKYFNIDPTLFRVGFILLTLLYGTGILLYIIMALVVPSEPVTSWQ